MWAASPGPWGWGGGRASGGGMGGGGYSAPPCISTGDWSLHLGETSKSTGCSPHIQEPAAANVYRKFYTYSLNAWAFWLQPVVMNFDVCP